MRTSVIVIFAFLLSGCASSQKSTSLNAEQARMAALRLANDKASTVYHCEPFHDGRPADLVAGHWVWVAQQDYGAGEVQAVVELAVNGSTNHTDLEYLNNGDLQPLPSSIGGRPAGLVP